MYMYLQKMNRFCLYIFNHPGYIISFLHYLNIMAIPPHISSYQLLKMYFFKNKYVLRMFYDKTNKIYVFCKGPYHFFFQQSLYVKWVLSSSISWWTKFCHRKLFVYCAPWDFRLHFMKYLCLIHVHRMLVQNLKKNIWY